MAQAGIKQWVVPYRFEDDSSDEYNYLIIESNNLVDAAKRADNWLEAQKRGSWACKRPKEPRLL